MMVEMALISGVNPFLMAVYISTGKVLESGVAKKQEITNWSKEIAKTNRDAARKPGNKKGNVTYQKV